MLVSEGKTALKRYGFDDSDPLLIWMNAGLHEFLNAKEWPFNFGTIDIDIEVGQTSIADTLSLGDDFEKVRSISSVSSSTYSKLKYLDISEFERVIQDPSQLGVPRLYTLVRADAIQFWPASDLERVFHIVYERTLEEMETDGDNMPGPIRIHYPIIQAAAMLGLQAENEEDRANNAQLQFEAAIERLWSKYSTLSTGEEPETVTDVMSYGY